MRIVNILQGSNLGGMEQASLRLMVGLKERGHSCEVVSLNPIAGLGPLLAEHDIPAVGLPYRGKWGWRSYFLRRRALQSTQADAMLMTGHNLLAMLAIGDFCRGRRLLAMHHYHTGVMPPWQWRLIYRIACSRFQAITFPSDFVRNEAEELYPPIKSLTHTVLNPLPIQPLPAADDRLQSRLALGIPLDVPLIGNAGWLKPIKRFDIFLRVAQRILRDVPGALFLIAGDGPERTHLETLARDLNIARRVRWLSWQRDLTHFYQSIDMLLFSSDWDAMPTTPLEALSRGIPLVASNLHGGLKEILNKDAYCFLIDRHDVEMLAAKAVYFLRNPVEAKQIAMCGRERVIEVSRVETLVKRIESLLL